MRIEVTQQPLMTFVLFAYNQEKVISEAVRSALGQKYHPLEIILSDDCSSDGTFGVMRQMAAAYHGPHRVLLNRNESNLGLVKHVNRVMDLASGELIVAAAGDDVSMPERCTRTYELWIKENRKAYYLSFGFYLLRNGGGLSVRKSPLLVRDIPTAILKADCRAVGCSSAWDRRLFQIFGPLPDFLHEEDVVLPFRALLASGVADSDEAVVVKGGDLCSSLSAENSVYKGFRGAQRLHETWQVRRVAALRGFADAVRQAEAKSLITPDQARYYEYLVQKSIRMRTLELELVHSSLLKRLRSALMLWFVPTVRPYSWKRRLFLLFSAPLPSLRDLEWRIRDRSS